MVRAERWSSCDDDAEVELYTLDGGGHQWPGGVEVFGLGDMSDTVSASDEMWRFFSRHRLP